MGNGKHVFVTGYSGAGKTTHAQRLAEEFGMPLRSLDSDPQYARLHRKGLTKPGTGFDNEVKAVRANIVRSAVAERKPHVFEGTQVLVDPSLTAGHRRVLVDVPERRAVDQRVRRTFLKTHKAPRMSKEEYRQTAKDLVGLYRDEVGAFRKTPGVEIIRPGKVKDNMVAGYLKPSGKYVLPREKEKKAYDDTIFSGDPTKLMPHLKQIHKFSEFPTGYGPEDLDAMKQPPGKVKNSQVFEYAETGPDIGDSGGRPARWTPGKIKRAAGVIPSMSEQYYMGGMGSSGSEQSMPLELVMMAGPQAAQGAQMAAMANRLAERPNQRLEQKHMAREADRARVVEGLARDLERLKLEEAGLLKKPGLLDRIMNKQGSFIPGVPDRAGMATSKAALSALADRTGIPLKQVEDSVRDVVGGLVPKMEKKGASFELPPRIESGHLVQTVGGTDRPRLHGVPRGSAQKSWKEQDSRGRTWYWKEARIPMALAQKARGRNEYMDEALYGLEKKGELTPYEKARITKDSMRAHVAPRMFAGSLGGAALGSLVGAATGKGVGVPMLAGTLAGAGLGAIRGAHLGKKRAPERIKSYEWKANKLIDPASLSRIAKKHGVTDAQARDSLILGNVRGHSFYPHEGSPGAKMKFMDDWVAADVPTLKKQAYKLQGETEVQGIPIAIENRKGSVRTGTDSDGNEWRTKMKHPYGYIKGTKGVDGEPVDVYVGPDKEAPDAFVVHQRKDDGKGYDEDKVMLGFPNKAEAKKAYLAHYDDPKFLGPMAKVSTERLKELVASKKRLVKISQVSYAAMLDEIMTKEAFKESPDPSAVKRRKEGVLALRKAGPGIGGALGAGIGAVIGAKRGKLLQGTIAGLGTGATLGWTPDMVLSAKEALNRYKRVT